MAFVIVLQINHSERERADKDLTDVITVSGTLKADTSIVDPVIQIKCNLEDTYMVNYMTIEVFGRSYFVTNIRSVINGLVEFSGHVDVLSTYKEAIRENNAIIRKQQDDWNLYLNDGSFKIYQNPKVLTKAFPSGFSTQEFVLAVAGS